jgi:hypothetical protein
MAVLVRNTAIGMDTAAYDQISAPLIELIKRQPGFVMHSAFPVPDGMMVGEIWETAEQHTRWFEESVRPNLPPDAQVKHEVIELHNLVVA